MLKQLPSRNQRSKGFKVKDALQICVLLAICIWLFYQAKKSYDRKVALESSGAGVMSNEVETEQALQKLGRRGLNPRLDEELAAAFRKRDDEDDLEEVGKLKEIEEAKEVGADDEIDGGDQQKTEEEEPEQLDDLIDEDDGEKEEASKGVRKRR